MPYISITVYDVAPKILPMFEQTLADYAMGMFKRQKITVKTDHSIQRIRPDPDGNGGYCLKVKEYGDAEVGAGIVVWSTGLMQNPLVEKLVQKTVGPGAALRLEKDAKTGGIIVDDRFRARLTTGADDNAAKDNATDQQTAAAASRKLLDDVFVIGDCAVVDSQPSLPKTAQVASQEAAYLAKGLNRNNLDAKPFRFRNLGTMTYLGGWRAIHQSSADHLTGWAAWVLWRTAYLTRSMSLKNKVLVPVYVSIPSIPLLSWFVTPLFAWKRGMLAWWLINRVSVVCVLDVRTGYLTFLSSGCSIMMHIFLIIGVARSFPPQMA